jgi:transcriptional regulator with XRE-family HTH domain
MTTPVTTDPSLSESALLKKIGSGLAQKRIRSGLSQEALARQAGVGKRTVERLEAGEPTQLGSFLRILRELGLLGVLDPLGPESGPSPMQLLKMKDKERRRASSRKSGSTPAAKPWTWGTKA